MTTLSSGIGTVWGMALDSTGNLFVANYDEDTVEEFASPIGAGASPAATISIDYDPCGLALDANGNLYVATYEGGSSSAGQLAEFTPPFSSSSTPAVSVS
ncbi:MAG TPA: hypothetical protein VMH02_08830, partial [Verrucomicrobiae bacterium]|nr:hypothetical protein [Verrucomicrobiae bacterium]